MKYGLENRGAGWRLKCPKCGEVCYLDGDQFYGRVSTFHDVPGCGYHETVDFSKTVAFPIFQSDNRKQ